MISSIVCCHILLFSNYPYFIHISYVLTSATAAPDLVHLYEISNSLSALPVVQGWMDVECMDCSSLVAHTCGSHLSEDTLFYSNPIATPDIKGQINPFYAKSLKSLHLVAIW